MECMILSWKYILSSQELHTFPPFSSSCCPFSHTVNHEIQTVLNSCGFVLSELLIHADLYWAVNIQ